MLGLPRAAGFVRRAGPNPADAKEAERKEAVMKPSIGRIVHYKNTDTEKEFSPAAELAPAIITSVSSDTCVNLAVFRHSWIDYKSSVLQGPGQGQWDWPARVD